MAQNDFLKSKGKSCCIQLKRYERYYFCRENPRASSKHGKVGSNRV